MKSFFSSRVAVREKYDAVKENADVLKLQSISETERIRRDIEITKVELESAYAGFDSVTDPDLIDCYIYAVNASLKRYRFLLSQVAGIEGRSLSEDEFI